MKYFNTKIVDYSYDEALVKVAEELKKEGFGVLTEIDVKETLKKKIDVDFRRYKIMGACNPSFAHKAISAEDNLGVLLPCNFVVQENKDGKTQISSVNPLVSMQSVENENLEPIAKEVSEKLSRVMNNL
ncbi:MAG: hypothetical protein CMF23_18760 [Ignavibacteriae bacterium]|jgi:uncharacterized protein (DUF302 family)|nr:hypothetical protein [Ignavibacteriota bacterium]|tara:strand:+ start:486 stop:872 length:387 start_codon:yes stop_codon:yes gene_type:complete